MTRSTVSAEDIDRMVDEGEDITAHIDMTSIEQPGKQPSRRVALDMTDPVIARLDAFAARYGVTRQSLMKVWLIERMYEEDERAARRQAMA